MTLLWGVNTLAALAFGVAFAHAAPLRAQVTPGEMAAAQELFVHAREHQAEKDWGACEAKLQRAVAILETPGLRFHLAFCKEQQHRWVEALVDYRRAGELAETGGKADDVRELLPPAIANLERLTPKLELLVDEPPQGIELFVDGKKVSGSLVGTPFPVDPGGRRVDVSAPGYEPFSTVVNLLPEEQRRVRIELTQQTEQVAAVPVQRAQPSAERGSQSSGVSTQAVVLAAEALVTIAGLGAGVGFTYEASSRARDRDRLVREIDDVSGCAREGDLHPLCPAVTDADEDAQTATDRATIGYVVAGAGAAAFSATWFFWPEDETGAGVGWTFTASESDAGVGLWGRF